MRDGGPAAPHLDPAADPWCVRLACFDPKDERRREALLALGNGVLVLRAAPCWALSGERHDPGLYRAGLTDALESEVAGERVREESLARLPNPVALSWRLDGEPEWFPGPGVEVLAHEHRLDMRVGLAERRTRVRDARGRRLRIREERLVSLARPRLIAQRLTLRAEGWSGRAELRAGLDGAVRNDNVARYAPYASDHLETTDAGAEGDVAWLDARLRGGGGAISVAARHALSAGRLTETAREGARLWRRGTVDLRAGEAVVVETVAALDWAPPGGRACARSLLAGAPGFEALRREQERAWARRWRRQDVEMEGEAGRTLRFHAFQLMQTLSPRTAALDVGIPARGWHGEAYRGHVFWDELFVMPVLATREPDVARAALLYRHRRLDAARRAAREAGLRGAMFPWRSAGTGREVTPSHQLNLLTGGWMPDHTHLQRHVGAAIARDVRAYVDATGDEGFLAGPGAEMICEVARMFASRAREAPDGGFDIRGVMGPDEYQTGYPDADEPGLANNAYTNLMASWTLAEAGRTLDALDAAARSALSDRIALGDDEPPRWERVSRGLRIPLHDTPDGPVLSQFEGFDRLRPPGAIALPEQLGGERLDWALDAVGESTNAYQMTKQADALTAFHVLGSEAWAVLERLGFEGGADLLARSARYYLARTADQSSLSRVVQAGALAGVDPEGSWRLFREALGTDLCALEGESTAEGIHLAAMVGTLDILQRHYLGLHPEDGALRVAPRPPPALGRVRLCLTVRGTSIEVRRQRTDAGWTLGLASLGGPDLVVRHGGGEAVLRAGRTIELAESRL